MRYGVLWAQGRYNRIHFISANIKPEVTKTCPSFFFFINCFKPNLSKGGGKEGVIYPGRRLTEAVEMALVFLILLQSHRPNSEYGPGGVEDRGMDYEWVCCVRVLRLILNSGIDGWRGDDVPLRALQASRRSHSVHVVHRQEGP